MCVVYACMYVCMPNVSEVINGQRAQHYEASCHHSQLDRAAFTTLQRGVARECHFEGVGLTICTCVCACSKNDQPPSPAVGIQAVVHSSLVA